MNEGTINVRFACKNECILSVEDDGVGIAIIKRGSACNSRNLGQGLVDALPNQLGGPYELSPRDYGSGTVACVRFPAPTISLIGAQTN